MTATKSVTVLDLLSTNIPEGQKAKVSTDNDLYGITVQKKGNTLLNVRTGDPLPLTSELIHTKFLLVNEEKELTLKGMLAAYEDGRKLRIQLGDKYRFIQKTTDEIPEELNGLIDSFRLPLHAVSSDEVMTIQELIEGKYYLVD